MWARMKRVFRSWMGAVLSAAEDPQLILEQNRRDMQDKIPEINTAIARAKGGLARLEKEKGEMEGQRDRDTEQLKTLLRSGDDAAAVPVAEKLQRTKNILGQLDKRIQAAEVGCEKLRGVKESFQREMEQKNSEADLAVRQTAASSWKPQIAEAFEAFDVADLTQTHEEMVGKLNYEADLAQGKLDMAQAVAQTSSNAETTQPAVDTEANLKDAEKKYENLQTQNILKEFKDELGLGEEKTLPLEPMTDGGSDTSKK